MPSRGEKIKETVVLSVLNVALPTFDVYSDLGLIANFFVGSRRNPFCDRIYDDGMLSVDEWWGINERRKFEIERLNCYYNDSVPTSNVTYTSHYGWGTMMLVPFLLNYFICWYVWATTDKRKAVSWVATLLSFYPQYIALKTIYQIWVSPQKGLQNKRRLERDLIQIEVFYEAVPSTLVMTYLLVRAMHGAHGDEIIYNGWDTNNTRLFYVAFFTSIITSSLGLAKKLKVGPCRILPQQKRYLEGLLAPRFILIFLALSH